MTQGWRCVFALCVVLFAMVVAANAESIWYYPRPDQRAPRGFISDPDYQQLFQNTAPWQNALQHIQVFGIGPLFANTGPDDELRRIFRFLNERHIALGVNYPLVTGTDCGGHTEGINHSFARTEMVAERIRNLGGTLSYILADEPLAAGHIRTASKRGEQNGCQFPIDALAANVANNFRQIRQVYPGVQLIDENPLTPIATHLNDVPQWVAALRRELGPAAPTAMVFDVQWNLNWQEQVRSVVAVLQRLGMGYGVMYNGDRSKQTNLEWTGAARSRIEAWEATLPVPPAIAVFISWNPNPDHVLPENDPGTILSVLDWYCSHSTQRVGCVRR